MTGTAEIGAPRPRVRAAVGLGFPVVGGVPAVGGVCVATLGALARGATTGRGIGDTDDASRLVSGSTTGSSTPT